MKQHITEEQFNEIAKEQRRKLEDLNNLVLATHQCFTIGKMIEILYNNYNEDELMIMGNDIVVIDFGGGNQLNESKHNELCDCLWEVIKKIARWNDENR